MYAEVAVYQAPVQRTYTYSVPDGTWSDNRVEVGSLIEVPFRTSRSQAIIIALTDETPVDEDGNPVRVRPIHDVIFSEPVVTPQQIQVAQWIARETFAPLGACLWLNLPPGLTKRGDFAYTLLDPDIHPDHPTLQTIFNLLRERGTLRAAQINRAIHNATDADVRWKERLNPLIAAGVIMRQAVLPLPDAKIRTRRAVRLLNADSESKLGTRAAQIVDYLKDTQTDADPIALADIAQALDLPVEAVSGALKRLEGRGLIELLDIESIRDPLAGRVFEAKPRPTLTDEQRACWEVLQSQIDGATRGEGRSETFLVHGVTGSGKTELYLRALQRVVAAGRQGIVLVPEIALVPQTVSRFASLFPDRTAVIHSELTEGEQFDTWRRARSGEYDVVIGARSALFTPLPDLGLIVIDEEHDDSYKQSPPLPAPYYHARDVAMAMMACGDRPGTVILGSATPGIVTAFKAARKQIHYLRLPNRVIVTTETGKRALELPPIELIDMRHELSVGNSSMFSRTLSAAIRHSVGRGEQVMLFLNRRGTATFVQCRECGYVVRCPRCEMPLTYHRAAEHLTCHACGHHESAPETCPECNSQKIRYFGAGTATVQDRIAAELGFPPERVLRWDRDTTGVRGAHEQILNRFADGEADILVGTQMIVKGLDLPRVTLVGVISADTALGLPDYRAGERTFQLLVQAAGRAGRSALGGRAIFQSYQPEHYAIQAAAKHDYRSFYEQEIGFRHALQYPPYRRLVRFVIREKGEQRAAEIAHRIGDALMHIIRQKELIHTELIGPAPTFFGRVDHVLDMHGWHILVRTTDPEALLTGFSLRNHCVIDIDPLDIL